MSLCCGYSVEISRELKFSMGISGYKFFLTAFILVYSLKSQALSLEQQREIFFQADVKLSAETGEDFAMISQGLQDYPLYSYLEYRWLSQHLDKKEQIQSFIHNNKSSRYARLLRQQWLSYLYAQQQWSDFVEHYQSSSSKFAQCRYQWARYKLNYKTRALKATQKIWLTGHSLPGVCDPLLEKFTHSTLLSQDLVWRRLEQPLRQGR